MEISYPAQLPISERRDEIAAAIRDNQVVILAGETGSGKTTQLPKICLELGRGAIGHTQPRRIAARTVAQRIAGELGVELGSVVGWKVRFTDEVSAETKVKLMTDGILLAELRGDRDLRRYDTLIIDEAHERSLNIDFLLGYVKQLLPRRPDLKLIITSATIDVERFSKHFGDAPIVEVSGRTYPVEVRYRPVVDPDDPSADPDRDQVSAIVDAVEELRREGPGDILVFLSGEREIRDTRDALADLSPEQGRDVEILPMFARLSAAEQHRVFASHPGRRVVLATNVAETSLTVPGIKFVVDAGTARISRYSNRLKVQRLPIERISQASANQRAGRCGRTSDGICIRLYTEDDFNSRSEFTEPEILRTNLASVILQMKELRLGEIAEFPFVEPPDKRQISDGLALLHELGAVDGDRLTKLGRSLARLPVDPRLGRMVLEADKAGCLREILVIASALSIQDPRERPVDAQEAADQSHARFRDRSSDFLGILNLWRYLGEQQEALSSTRFRKMCRAEYLHYLRVREWQDLHSQLRRAARSAGLHAANGPVDVTVDPRALHTALLAGLLSHIGLYDPEKRDYLGARGARFAIWPGSALARKNPRAVMAAELVETSRLWGRATARIEPEWVEPLAQHLVKRNYSDPHWERRRSAVVALERVTLYGVPIVTARKINYSRIDPEHCRDEFIRKALVEGDWDAPHAFLERNRLLLDEVSDLEDRARRRDIVVDEDTLFDFYDQRVPSTVVSGRDFDKWWRGIKREQPNLLDFDPAMLVHPGADVSLADFPDRWGHGGLELDLSYDFEPGSERDGVTVQVPLAVLNRVSGDGFDWQVPGHREELVIALLRALPKPIRRELVPVPDTARAALARMSPAGPLLASLERAVREVTGVVVPPSAWRPDDIPPHLRLSFEVVGDDGTVLGRGKDLDALKAQHAAAVAKTVAAAGSALERNGLRDWPADLEELPRVHRQGEVTGYPALSDEGGTAGVRLLPDPDEQARSMWAGSRRLALVDAPSPMKAVRSGLSTADKLALQLHPHRDLADLLADCQTCAADDLIDRAGGPAWNRAGFEKLRTVVVAGLGATVADVVRSVRDVLAERQQLDLKIASVPPAFGAALDDVRRQRDALVYRGFVTATGADRLRDVTRYLQAASMRLDKLRADPGRDARWAEQVDIVRAEYEDLVNELGADHPGVREIRWMIEELRVSLFAQPMRTRFPVSVQRIQKAIDAL